jgi:DNA replication and repair protein RecF
MLLNHLKISSFRNLESIDLKLNTPDQITIFLGENANGKTNILESIYLLSFPKSFRGHALTDMINFQQNFFNIQANFTQTESDNKASDLENKLTTNSLQFGYQTNPSKKVYRHNQVEVDLKDFIVHLQAVIFTPEDIELVHGSPQSRRKLINSTLGQFSSEYLENYSKFQNCLKQRNALLKRIRSRQAQTSELTFWNNQFTKLATAIHQERLNLFQYFQSEIKNKYHHISDSQQKTELKFLYHGKEYEPQFDNYSEIIEYQLQANQSDEIRRGYTLCGPQKDDWQFYLNSQPADKFASRGEKRSLMLALKVVELEYLQSKTNRQPILLLDDVFSELDKTRRLKLLQLCNNYQTFISTVETSYFQESKQPIQVYKVEKGQVFEYNS